MSTIYEASITVCGTEYAASVDGDRVSISRRQGGIWVWSGDGRWNGSAIEDCAADLGDDVYDALDTAIAAAMHP